MGYGLRYHGTGARARTTGPRGSPAWTVRRATLCQSLCCAESAAYCVCRVRVPGAGRRRRVPGCRTAHGAAWRRAGWPNSQRGQPAASARIHDRPKTAKFQHMNMQHQPGFTSHDPIARLAATPIPTRELAESTQPPPPPTPLTQAHPAQCSPACRQEQSPREPPHLPLDCCPASTADSHRQRPRLQPAWRGKATLCTVRNESQTLRKQKCLARAGLVR